MSGLSLAISPLCCNIGPHTDTEYHPLVLPPHRPACSHYRASLPSSLSAHIPELADHWEIIVLHYGSDCVGGEVYFHFNSCRHSDWTGLPAWLPAAWRCSTLSLTTASQARTLDCSHHNYHPSHCFLLLQVMEELE